MTRYYTSDPHFGHRKVAQLRGFDDVVEHDEWIISSFNRVVGSDDILYILGDLTIGPWDYALERASQLNGRKRLVSGNHDATWPLHRDWQKYLRPTLEVFESVSTWEVVRFGKHKVMLTHLPYKSDAFTDDRFMNLRLQSDLPLLCGHVHDSWASKENMLNVGVDIWGEPLSDFAVEYHFGRTGYFE